MLDKIKCFIGIHDWHLQLLPKNLERVCIKCSKRDKSIEGKWEKK